MSAIVMPPPEAPALTQVAQGVLAAVNKRVPRIDTEGLLSQLKAQPTAVLIDVRTPAELGLSGTPIVVYCGVSAARWSPRR